MIETLGRSKVKVASLREHAPHLEATVAKLFDSDTEARGHGARGGVVMRNSTAVVYSLDLDLYLHEGSLA